MKNEIGKTLHQSKSLLWGISVALSWTWGIGLFFSVQMAVQFGIVGLASFAIMNALGLGLFGFYTHRLSRRFDTPAAFEEHFFRKAQGLRRIFYLYQILAILITLFALLRYIFLPLGFPLPLVALMILGLTFFLGEEFNITRIKYVHSYVMLGILVMMVVMLTSVIPNSVFPPPFTFEDVVAAQAADEVTGPASGAWVFADPPQAPTTIAGWPVPDNLQKITNAVTIDAWHSTTDLYFLFFLVPIAIGFFLGPWLDLQQWQRAIQIRKEGLNIAGSYACGALIFFCLLIFHGMLALVVFRGTGSVLQQTTIDGLFHAKDVMMRFFQLPGNEAGPLAGFYIGFVVLCALPTLDSGYLALRWFFEDAHKRSESPLLAFLPPKVLTSPLIHFVGATVVGIICAYIGVELEYIGSFYGSFLVVYITIFYRKVMFNNVRAEVPHMKALAVALFSISLFAIGYFREIGMLMAIASMIPFAYGMFITSMSKSDEKAASAAGAKEAEATVEANAADSASDNAPKMQQHTQGGAPLVPMVGQDGESDAGQKSLGTYFDDEGWFTYKFITTYADTNSTGNVYFGMYALFVGKARELFFRHAMPDFDVKTSDYLILTRSFNHKYIMEAREFEVLKVKIRIAKYNRKFFSLDHQILNENNEMLGKGNQQLLFVSSEDYRLINIPQKMYTNFLPYVATNVKEASGNTGVEHEPKKQLTASSND